MIVHGQGMWLLDDSGMMLWTLVILMIGIAIGVLAHKLLSSRVVEKVRDGIQDPYQ